MSGVIVAEHPLNEEAGMKDLMHSFKIVSNSQSESPEGPLLFHAVSADAKVAGKKKSVSVLP